MKEFIDYLNKEWSTVSKAPFTFILLLVITFTAVYVIARWRYESIIGTLKERIEGYKDRINSKDEQLNEYRQRLNLVPINQTSYSRLTNIDLKNQALQVVSKIRDFLKVRQSNKLMFTRMNYNNTMSEEEREQAWHSETQAMIQDSLETNANYDSLFKVDTILLRDELLSRIPKNIKNEIKYSIYEHPTNPLGMGEVADDLEQLAKSLPV
ncbi:hypothetical protein [Paenibacillus amylolyticus]|uniref:hypothetical protein n=1 Tax=Paenibacillus amylolyticus TaxID=1451 RepID=UPI003D9673C7